MTMCQENTIKVLKDDLMKSNDKKMTLEEQNQNTENTES